MTPPKETRPALWPHPERGYVVKRTEYNPNNPCYRAVEIAYSNDKHAPIEHSSPQTLSMIHGFRYPGETVEQAVKMLRAWIEELPKGTPEEDLPKLTVTTGGGEFLPEVYTEEALRAWADERWNGFPEAPPPTPEEKELSRKNAIHWADLVRKAKDRVDKYPEWVSFSEEPDYDVDLRELQEMAWDMSSCQEEAEENYDVLCNSVDNEGIYTLQGFLHIPGRADKLVSSISMVFGPVVDEDWIDVWNETLDALENYFQEEADLLADRATYAGFPDAALHRGSLLHPPLLPGPSIGAPRLHR